MSKPRERKLRKVQLPWTSITLTSVDVFDVSDTYRVAPIGAGLLHYDGDSVIHIDLIDLVGNPLPGDRHYNIGIKDEPVLAVLATSVQ